jgi:hypothetical protein
MAMAGGRSPPPRIYSTSAASAARQKDRYGRPLASSAEVALRGRSVAESREQWRRSG